MNEEWLKERTKEELIEMLVNEIDATRELLNNWNELKKWLEENKYAMSCKVLVAEEILNKMQELEGNND